ncbi:MAG: hypothetical protein ACRDN9_12625 [Streptosporangiaceae bacterium]
MPKWAVVVAVVVIIWLLVTNPVGFGNGIQTVWQGLRDFADALST